MLRSNVRTTTVTERYLPYLLGLRRVVPVSGAQRRGDVMLTPTALELYEHGQCVVRLSLVIEAGPGAADADARFGRAFFAAVLRDDRGRVYRAIETESHGFTGPNYVAQRAWVHFPGFGIPGPDVRTVEIVIEELRWRHYEPPTEGAADANGYRTIYGETTVGPWRFTATVADPDKGASTVDTPDAEA